MNPGKAAVAVSVPLLLATPNIPEEFIRKYTPSRGIEVEAEAGKNPQISKVQLVTGSADNAKACSKYIPPAH